MSPRCACCKVPLGGGGRICYGCGGLFRHFCFVEHAKKCRALLEGEQALDGSRK